MIYFVLALFLQVLEQALKKGYEKNCGFTREPQYELRVNLA